jgi:hypothetical protein
MGAHDGVFTVEFGDLVGSEPFGEKFLCYLPGGIGLSLITDTNPVANAEGRKGTSFVKCLLTFKLHKLESVSGKFPFSLTFHAAFLEGLSPYFPFVKGSGRIRFPNEVGGHGREIPEY